MSVHSYEDEVAALRARLQATEREQRSLRRQFMVAQDKLEDRLAAIPSPAPVVEPAAPAKPDMPRRRSGGSPATIPLYQPPFVIAVRDDQAADALRHAMARRVGVEPM